MKQLIKRRKGLALLATLVVAAAATIGAYAYFAGTGTGTGSAQSATATSLTITQIGAGYDSLIPIPSGVADPYHQDQCFSCASITEFGNKIKLANPGWQRLTSAVVAFTNRGLAFSDVQFTITIVDTGATSTVKPSIAAAQPNGRPTATEVTFPFNTFVPQEFTYKITYDATGDAGSTNVALSNSQYNVAVGSDSANGHVWVNTTAGAGIAGDFPSCTTPGTGFAEVQTNCGLASLTNPGAYGTNAQVTAGNADIPAVEFNVVGGVAPSLYPGGPAQPIDFAILNPGSASVHVGHVAIKATGNSKSGNTPACYTSWYSVSPGAPGVTLNTTVPPGWSLYQGTGANISMTETNTNQSACEGATVDLSFTAGP